MRRAVVTFHASHSDSSFEFLGLPDQDLSLQSK
jgi:hypothetical protein